MTNSNAPLAAHLYSNSPMPLPVPPPSPSIVDRPVGRLRTAEPGAPYHRLARTAAHRWWKPLVGTLVVLVGSLAAQIFVGIVAGFVGVLAGRPLGPDGMPSFGPTIDLALLLLMVALMTPSVLLAARWIQARPAGSVSSVVGRLRWRWLGRCLLVAVPTVILTMVGSAVLLAATGDVGSDEAVLHWAGTGSFVAGVLMLLVLVPFQAAAEEYVYRGWLMQSVGAFFRTPWAAIAIQAPLFAAMHGWGTPWGFADLTIFGLVLAWLTVRTGGLEAGIALHMVNNLVAMTILAAVGDLGSDETAADSPWQMFLASAIMNIGYAVVISWLTRRRRIDTVVPAPLAQ